MRKSVHSILVIMLFSLITLSIPKTEAYGQTHVIKISTGKCRLWLYELRDNGTMKLIREYRVGTVKPGLKKYPLGEGVVTKIDFNPIWHPTAYTRWYLGKKGQKIPSRVPAGHPLNYMGEFRISLSHNVPGKGPVYRIHGVRKGDEWTVGKRVSGGCIRMLNEPGKELARTITVGTKVIIVA